MAKFYARLINQYRFNWQIIFSARVSKLHEDDQVLDEIELYNSLNINQNITESDIDINNVMSQSENQIHNQETKDSSWIFDKINSRQQIPVKLLKWIEKFCQNSIEKFTILNFKNYDKNLSLWLIRVKLYPGKKATLMEYRIKNNILVK